MPITMTSDEAHRDWCKVIEKAHSNHEVKAGDFYTQEEVEQGLREHGLL